MRKTISQLLPFLQLPYRVVGNDVSITHITYDSRQVQEGSLFVAIKGFKSDGHDHIPMAIEKGAVALLVDHQIENNLPE